MQAGGQSNSTWGQARVRNRYKCNLARRIELIENRDLYTSPISTYATAPNANLSVTDFERYALARLKVLRIIERQNLLSPDKFSVEWRNKIEAEIRRQDIAEFIIVLFSSVGTEGVSETEMIRAREFDHISHFLLRLAFAGTEEHRKWFISLEMDLFTMRLRGLVGAASLRNFLLAEEFPGKLVEKDEKEKYRTEICNSVLLGGGLTIQQHNKLETDIYKVSFEYALDLVRLRKVFLRNGEAYVHHNELVSIICTAFRSHLSEGLSMVKKNMHIVEQDERIMQVVADFDRRHTGNNYGNKKENVSGVSADELPTLSQKSFPLCMRSLYDVVVKEHHLKHFGRLQLGLFLKAIGVPIDEAVKFWRGHFTKKPEIDGTRFDKQYLYNIRHMYGQEGRRADYTPYSCMKVIMSNVGPGDHHGCPFKHSDQQNLRAKLVEAQVPSNGMKEIMDLVEKHHFQIACQKYFEWTHGSMTVEGGVNHPNQYFEESRDVLSGKKTIKTEDVIKTKRVVVMPDGSQRTQTLLTSEMETQPLSSTNPETDGDPLDTPMEEDSAIVDFLASQGY